MKNIAIFASGTGSNARKIIEYFQGNTRIKVVLVISNKAKAAVLPMATSFGIENFVINRKSFYQTESLLIKLNHHKIDYIALAGFLWLIPDYLVKAYDKKILNIHPALLPKYGGKGMYGHYVHEAVKVAGEKKTGITIHFVNQQYDEGDIVFQIACALNDSDSPTEIAKKVLALEHKFFPKTLENVINNNIKTID